jgi:hypothetical protein
MATLRVFKAHRKLHKVLTVLTKRFLIRVTRFMVLHETQEQPQQSVSMLKTSGVN